MSEQSCAEQNKQRAVQVAGGVGGGGEEVNTVVWVVMFWKRRRRRDFQLALNARLCLRR